MNQEMLDRLSKHDWITIGQKLMAVSVFWAKCYHGKNWRNLPKGYTLDDVVQESLRRAFTKKWEDFNAEEFIQYLFGASRSVISNLAKSAKIQKTDSSDLFSIQVADEHSDFTEQLDREDTLNRIRNELGTNTELIELLEDIMSGLEPQEIAEGRGLPVKEVYNRKKRLVRIIEKIAEEE